MEPGIRFALTIIVHIPNEDAPVDCLEKINTAIDVATAALADHPETGVIVEGQGGAFVYQLMS